MGLGIVKTKNVPVLSLRITLNLRKSLFARHIFSQRTFLRNKETDKTQVRAINVETFLFYSIVFQFEHVIPFSYLPEAAPKACSGKKIFY